MKHSPDYCLRKFPPSTSEIISFFYLAQSPLAVWCNNVLGCHYFKNKKPIPAGTDGFWCCSISLLAVLMQYDFNVGDSQNRLLSGEFHVKYSVGTAHSLIKPDRFFKVWTGTFVLELRRGHVDCHLCMVQLIFSVFSVCSLFTLEKYSCLNPLWNNMIIVTFI